MDDIISHLHHSKWIGARSLAYLNAGFRQPAEALMHMNAGRQGLDSHASKRSRVRAATEAGAPAQRG